jgi:hypothetical protein
MEARFFKKPAHFEKKSQIIPNALIYDKNLTDPAVRLLLALNALPEKWTIIQSDIQQRLGWGREKMRRAIKVCVDNGYMRHWQSRHEESNEEKGYKKGQFYFNEFEFDTEPSFSKINEHSHSEECPHIDCEPMTGFPSTGEPATTNLPQQCSLEYSYILEQTNSDVVCSHEDDQQQSKRDLLEQYPFNDETITSLIEFDLPRITNGIEAAEQYAENKQINDMCALINKSIRSEWKPNITKSDIQKQQQKKELELIEKIQLYKIQANNIIEMWKNKFNNNFRVEMSDNKVYIIYPNGSEPLALTTEGCIEKLTQKMEQNLT